MFMLTRAPIPHFHLISKDKKFETCICIFEPLYFIHETKTGTLNSKQRKHLNNWMNQMTKYTDPRISNWQTIKLAWILNNGTKFKEVIRNYPQPNYSDMINYKNTDHYWFLSKKRKTARDFSLAVSFLPHNSKFLPEVKRLVNKSYHFTKIDINF